MRIQRAHLIDRMRLSRWGIVAGGFMLFAVACQSTPEAASERPPASTASRASPDVSSAAATSTGAAQPSVDCAAPRKAVVDEASRASTCQTDADCTVHRITLCDFDELDCHAAHVNKVTDIAALDKAVSAYGKDCDVSRCKCEVPTKSVCTGGRCGAG